MIESTGNGPQQPADGPLSPLRNAALLLKQAHARIDNLEQLRRQPIAIVGAGCRLPGGVNDLDTFWSRLLDGFDAVREVPAERWNVDEHYDPEPGAQGKMYTRWGGFLENVDQFDNDFFGISYREAAQTDPQHRLLLETAWEALESAGVVPASLAGSRTGVYVGIISNDYALAQSKSLITLDGFAGTGSAHSIAANRLSYVLNLRGPSLALDTACSSSLVAIHLACQSLVRGETDLGLAGGVNLTLGPELTVALSAARMMAPDGRCKAFDASANGYVRGEGCGMVLLKRLADARRDGDRILGVIRGSAVNHDGRSNGLSAPSGPAQEDVIRAALESAGVEPSRISYVEAHGTGTKLGDSIEIQALLESLGKDRTAEKLLHVGSVKTNIGHLEAAAGIAGLLKALLILKHKTIPASLHVRQLNPLLAIEGTPLRIPTETTPIPASDGPLCVGVSSFGFGGTNSHIVLEEPPVEPAKPAASQRDWHLLTLSGAKPGALRELARKHRECVDPSLNGHSPAPAPLAAASALTRTHSRYRAALPFRTLDDLRPQLEKLAAAPENAADVSSSDDALRRSLQEHGVAFLFTGQGAQYIGMGKGLYASEPVFRAAVDRAAKFLEPKLGCNLAGFITGADQPAELLTRTRFTQPAMFVVQHALVELWRSWGVEPSAVLGHSVAEFAAAWAAGVLSLEDALTLVAERGRLMDSLPSGGAMAAVLALVEDVRAELARYAGRVEIAALNGPQNTVVAGEESAVLAVVAAFEARGVRATRLDTSHAFHSRLMEPALDEFERIASSFVHHAPNCDFISTLTGAKLTGPINADYWRRHARQAVRFAEAIESLVASGRRVFVEIGPQPTLIGMARRCTPAGDFAWLPSLRRQAEDGQTIFTSLGRLYELGQEVAWNAVYPREMLRGVELPTYPFQRQRCWITEHRRVASASIVPGVEEAVHPLLGRRVRVPLVDVIYETEFIARKPALLAALGGAAKSGASASGEVVAPAAAFVELAAAVAGEILPGPATLETIELPESLSFAKDSGRAIQTIATPESDGRASFRIASRLDSETAEPTFLTHATGRIRPLVDADHGTIDVSAEWAQIATGPGVLGNGRFVEVWNSEDLALAKLAPLTETNPDRPITFDASLLHSALELAATLAGGSIPARIGKLALLGDLQEASWCRVSVTRSAVGMASADVQLCDESGRILCEAAGVEWRPASVEPITRAELNELAYELAWDEAASPAVRSDAPGHWLVIGDASGDGRAVAETLQARGASCEVIPAVDASESLGVRVLARLTERPTRGVLHLGSLDAEDAALSLAWDAARDHGWGQALELVQTLGSLRGNATPRLWLATRGAVRVGARQTEMNLAQSPLWGFGRVAAVEHPELACVRIDLEPNAPFPIDLLTTELLASSREDQVAFRGDKRFVARLRRATVEQTALSLPTGAYRIEFAQSDAGASIAARPVVRRRPGRGEVEVEVRAVAVTARDRNRLLGLDESAKAKLEFAGVVVAVGPGVTAPLVGSPVVGLASGTFGSHVVASANQVSAKPPVQSFVEAVSRATSIRTLPVSQIATALDALADPKAGRVVLTVGEDAKLLRSDRSYLLTGGLGGLGLRLAEWLAENGAGPLVLLGRSAPAGETLAVIEKLRGLGARIETRRCDASNREQLAAVFAEFGGKLPPLGGVFHLAGVLDDGLLRDQSRERFDAVMGAKVQGAWHLDDLSRNQPVEHFVLFSSAASLLGSPGQGNYASANAFLDSLAASRRMEGLPGLAVNWGNWSEVGMAAAIAGREGARWAATGVGWVRPTLGLAALGEWMTADRAQVGLVPIDWATFFERVPVGAEPMWLAELTTRRAATDAPPAAAELKAKIADVPSGERFAVVLRHVVERCAKLLKNPAGDLPDPQRAVYELGFDSLLGVEFCNLLALDVGRPVSPVVLFEHPTLESLARYLTDELALAESEAAGTSAGAETSGSGASADGAALDDTPAGATADELRLRAVKAVEEMSEAEMEALVELELRKLSSPQ